MRYLSMFSGIEAASVAWRPLGWEAAAVCEIEPFPSAVLAHHYPTVPNLGDVTKADFDGIGQIDLAVFGSPCQSFSVAGKRLGLDDPRGNLALVAGSVVYSKRPRWFVFENVPGLLSSDEGWDFGTLLAAFAGHPSGSVLAPPADGWGTSGVAIQANAESYGLAWRILDAQYFGVPQRRRRVFVVGYLGDWRRAAAVFLERASLQGNPPPSREAGEGVAPSPSLRARANSSHRADSQAFIPDVGYALNAHGGAHGRQDAESETLIAHSLRGEGFDASEDGTGRGTPLVVDTLTSNGDAHSGFRDEKGLVPIAFALRGREGGAMPEAHDQASALRAASGGSTRDYVAFDTTQITSKANYSNPQAGDACHPLAAGAHAPAIAGSAVRRLTPAECERLQGFPDGYTAITYRGKPAADGPRYKAMGNSMAVPVMAWVGERIALVEAIASISEAA